MSEAASMSGTGKMWRRNWQVNALVESRFKLHQKLSNSGQSMLHGCAIIITEIGSMALAVAWRNPNPVHTMGLSRPYWKYFAMDILLIRRPRERWITSRRLAE